MPADVLVLNRNFYAIEVASWERAMALLYLGRASVVDDEYNIHDFEDWVQLSQAVLESPGGFVHTPTLKVAIPEVIALNFFDKVPKQQVPFTRRNIYEHYGHHCCYCSKRFPPSELNLDHVVPRSRGGTTDWANIVTACIPCNLRKGNRLPAEAHMKLKIPISKPKFQYGVTLMWHAPIKVRRSWQRFVDRAYWDSQLEE
jgi:5-methylcytosine-specific restriction endonuclease McrA